MLEDKRKKLRFVKINLHFTACRLTILLRRQGWPELALIFGVVMEEEE